MANDPLSDNYLVPDDKAMEPNSLSNMNGNAQGEVKEKPKFKARVIWPNVLLFIMLHAGAVYGLYLTFSSAYRKTIIFGLLYGYCGGMGVTAGCHRLWTHRSYKAKFPLRVLLSVWASIAAQNDIYVWCRDHRVHHKFAETDADPHNIKRGFFFAHMGWLMCKKHPDVFSKGGTLKFDDLWADPVIRFQRKYFMPMVILFSAFLPIMIPYWMWNEDFVTSVCICFMFRLSVSLHLTWLVNSAAHMYGTQPYDLSVDARENVLVSFFGNGEGWHNYHHVFPWDYAASELGYTFNTTKMFLDLMGLLGMAYDFKSANSEMVRQRMQKTGDKSRKPRSFNMNSKPVY